MGIRNRQIGASQEANLWYEVLRLVRRLRCALCPKDLTQELGCFPVGDYVVFTYEFPIGAGTDLDTVSTLIVPVVQDSVGYCINDTLPSGVYGGPYMFWGGDNRSPNGSESIYINVSQLLLNYPSMTELQFVARANWYTQPVGTGIINLKMSIYSGGTMVSNGNFGFNNVGGTLITTQTFPQPPVMFFSNDDTCKSECIGTFTYNIITGCIDKTPTCSVVSVP